MQIPIERKYQPRRFNVDGKNTVLLWSIALKIISVVLLECVSNQWVDIIQ